MSGTLSQPLTLATPAHSHLRCGRLLVTLQALIKYFAFGYKLNYSVNTIAWLVVIVWHKALARSPSGPAHYHHRPTPHPTARAALFAPAHSSLPPTTTARTAPHRTHCALPCATARVSF